MKYRIDNQEWKDFHIADLSEGHLRKMAEILVQKHIGLDMPRQGATYFLEFENGFKVEIEIAYSMHLLSYVIQENA